MIRVSLYQIDDKGSGKYLIGGYAKSQQDVKQETDRLKQRARFLYGVTNIYFVIEE